MSETLPKTGPLDTLWQASTIAWMILAGECVALVLALAPGVTQPRPQYLLFLSLAIQWMLLASLALLYGMRRWLQRLTPLRVGLFAVAVLLACAWTLTAIVGYLFGTLSSDATGMWAGLRWQAAALALVVGLMALGVFHAQWRYRQSVLRAKQAELAALQARLQPHFLFNTLNSAAALVHTRPDDAEKVLLGMADLFRAALAPPGWVALGYELDLVRRYLEIEQLRFGDRLTVQWDVGLDENAIGIPLLTIQPLVENAVMHGTTPETNDKRVGIAVIGRGNELVVTVENPIPGVAASPLHGGHGVGLAGIRARLESATHDAGRLTIQRTEDRFIARLSLPLRAMPQAAIR